MPYPICLHTTLPSSQLNPFAHTVPHSPKWRISSRPAAGVVPPTRRTEPSTDGAHGGGGDGGGGGGSGDDGGGGEGGAGGNGVIRADVPQ